jgi:hypothetical protein
MCPVYRTQSPLSSFYLFFLGSYRTRFPMSSNTTRIPDTLWHKLVMSEETRRLYPSAPAWTGGFRWFESRNVVDLQNYRSPAEKERIRTVVLGR